MSLLSLLLYDIIDKYVYATDTGETDTLIYSNIKRIEFRFANVSSAETRGCILGP